jgi:plasmid segregation protein ParM
MRFGTNPRFFGREYDLAKYLPLGKDRARQFMAVLANKVGPAADINNILLAGGGAEFFLDLVAEKFPKHNIQITPDPVYANVRASSLPARRGRVRAAPLQWRRRNPPDPG